jgi:NAD-dependent deacetylase
MEELIEKAARDLVASSYAIALTGAGISTESGIPDFRGPDGIWTKNPEAERQAYQAYEKFKIDPKGYWEERLSPEDSFWSLFAERFKNVQPNLGHYALSELEEMGILKCAITQNVDGLHQKAGNRNVIEYHGGLEKLRCIECGSRFDRERFDLEELKSEGKLPPRCEKCGGVMKEDGVFFGEPIPADVLQRSEEEAWKCDLMLICGTSAVVTPFTYLPRIARQRRKAIETPSGLRSVEYVRSATIIEVNADPTPLTLEGVSDYLIRGKTGEILPKIVEQVKRIK